MKQKEGFVLREICGEKVIVAEGLNEQLAEAICPVYNVEPSKALTDVTRILDEWKELGLIE